MNDRDAENDYVMKAIMRVVSSAQELISPLVATLLESLNTIVQRQCANPTNPHFSHYLFETVAAIVRFICEANPSTVSSFEELLFPPFQHVLQMDVVEFTPYVFQILAEMLCYHIDGLSEAYISLFPPLLSPLLWERAGNVPALVLLIKVRFSIIYFIVFMGGLV